MIWMADVLRVGIYVAYACVMGQALATLWFYLVAKRSLRKQHRKTPGLLLNHVIAVSVSYMGLATLVFTESVARVGTPMTWKGPYSLVFLLIGNWALFLIMRFEHQRRLREAQPVLSYHLPGESYVVDEHPPFRRGEPARHSRKS